MKMTWSGERQSKQGKQKTGKEEIIFVLLQSLRGKTNNKTELISETVIQENFPEMEKDQTLSTH